MTTTEAAPATRTERAHPDVLRAANAAIWSQSYGRLLAMFVPIFAVLAIVTRPGRMTELLVVIVLAGISGGLAAWLISRARVEFRGDRFVEVGGSGTRVVPMAAVTGITILHVYDANGVGVRPHLFAVDSSGRSVLRLRGRYWSEAQMTAVAARFDVPVELVAEPVTMGDLRRARGRNLYWIERHPLLAGFGAVLGVLGVVAVLVLVTSWALM